MSDPAKKSFEQLADEAMRDIAEHRERYVRAWLAETGYLPSQCELVEQWTPDGLTLRARPRSEMSWPASRLKRVCIESPLSGEVARNVLYADCCQFDALVNHGEAPYLGHLLYTRMFNDESSLMREAGIRAHIAWLEVADVVAVYTDLGITGGMTQAIELCARIEKPIAYRSLGADWQQRFEERLHATPGFFDCIRC